MTSDPLISTNKAEDQRAVPWRDIAIAMIALALVFLGLNAMQGMGRAAATLSSVGKTAFLIYVPLIWISRRKERFEDYGLRFDRLRQDLKTALGWALATLPIFMLLYVLWRGVILDKTVVAHLDMGLARGAAIMILVIGVPEEIFFRGWLQSLLSRRWGERGPDLMGVRIGPDVWLSAALFAAAHVLIKLNPAAASTFVPALAFGWIRKKTGSVFGAGLFHGLCNAAVLVFNPGLIAQ